MTWRGVRGRRRSPKVVGTLPFIPEHPVDGPLQSFCGAPNNHCLDQAAMLSLFKCLNTKLTNRHLRNLIHARMKSYKFRKKLRKLHSGLRFPGASSAIGSKPSRNCAMRGTRAQSMPRGDRHLRFGSLGLLVQLGATTLLHPWYTHRDRYI